METPSRKSEATLGRLVSLVSGAVGPPPPGPSVKARSDGRRRVLVASDPRYARKKPSEGRLLRPPRTGQPERGSPPSPVVGYAWVIRYYGITVFSLFWPQVWAGISLGLGRGGRYFTQIR